jgi:hypothetical protein
MSVERQQRLGPDLSCGRGERGAYSGSREMNAREVESAAAEVDSALQRALRSVAVAGVVALIGLAVVSLSPGFAVALGVGAIIELGAALTFWLWRRERVQRLALEPAAYSIPAVATFGARAATLKERRRLASFIESVVSECGHPLELHLPARARAHARALEALARQLAAPSVHVDPAVVVACRRLLTRPVESPLYNDNLPEEDLRAVLMRLSAAIRGAELQTGLTVGPR